jgi:hypothetical protein
MPVTDVIINNFSAGELSPWLDGRVDLDVYHKGCSTLENFIIKPQGGIKKRPGTRYVAEVKDSSAKTRLIPFVYSTVQAYIIEMGNLYFRFYKDHGQIQSGSPLSAVEVAHPYATAELWEVQYTQSADVLYLVHKDYAPRKLTRTSHTSWTLNTVSFVDGPYLAANTDSTKTLTPSAATGSITITATGHSPFASTDVGRHVRIKHGSTWGYAEITTYISATQVHADVKKDFGGTTASSDWRLGAWSATTGYPGSVCFYENRLWFASSTDNPQTIWGSNTDSYEDFSPSDTDGTVSDSHGVTYTIVSREVNDIKWLSPGSSLAIGTSNGIFLARSSSRDDPLTPTNIQIKREVSTGCAADISPVRVGNVVLFAERAGRNIREFVYNFESDGYVAPNLTIIADHIFEQQKQIKEIAFQDVSFRVLWIVRTNGDLAGMTYDRENNAVGWHQHFIGGSGTSASKDVEAIAVIPSTYQDEVWIITKRTIDGSTKRYIEYMALHDDYSDINGFEAHNITDCSLTYNGSLTNTITGLDHLEGESVEVYYIDPASFSLFFHETATVSSGQVTLTGSIAKAIIGLNYTSKMQTMRLSPKQAGGSTQGKQKRIGEAIIRTLKGNSYDYGPDSSSLYTATVDSSLTTKDNRVIIPSKIDSDGYLLITQDKPDHLDIAMVLLNQVYFE